MIQFDNIKSEILSLYSYHNSKHLLKSLLFRNQGKVIVIENSAMIIWGPSIMIGGEFSKSISENLNTLLQNSDFVHYIYSPDGKWKHYIENTYFDGLVSKQINLYQADEISEIDSQGNQHITPITDKLFKRNLPNSQLIKDELYSYKSLEEFYENGFGLALVIDDAVCGYCLSEYSIDDECGINIWVDEKYRGLGYAKMMTKLFLRHCKNNNWKAFWGCVSDNMLSNKTALSCGFTLHSIQDYYEWKKL